MRIKIYQLDAFTDSVFGGNPAAVCPLDQWLSDETMQNIAMENNLAETAFYVKEKENYRIRWFTPAVEVDLCGHATLAAAYVLFNIEKEPADEILFQSRSGILKVSKDDDLLTLNFPADSLTEIEPNLNLTHCFDQIPESIFKGKTDYLFVFHSELQIKTIRPNFSHIASLDARGVIITARGDQVDFVSRFFAPQCGIDEDPVTGSAHTSLVPYWNKMLQKKEFKAIQLSNRKGLLRCAWSDGRVLISGNVVLYLIGEIIIP
jgi:PhzF family phenazine biosynthesis protein